MDANFRWFEGEKAQYRFVPYGWAFLLIAPQAQGPKDNPFAYHRKQ
jgi:hypothetical protein